jgi:GH18 family chitinase
MISATAAESKTITTSLNGSFVVIGSFQKGANESTIQYDYLTYLNYADIFPTASGGLTNYTSGNIEQLKRVVAAAHSKGVKVTIAVGGWNNGNETAFETMAGSSTARTAFVKNLADFVTTYNLDGANIDWEFPSNTTEAGNFTLLMAELTAKLHGLGKVLTVSVSTSYGSSISDSVLNNVDLVRLMSYDKACCGSPHSSYDQAVSDLTYWKNRGVPKSKLVLGIPFYGRKTWTEAVSYKEIVALDPTAPYKDENGYENVNGYYYNSIPTVKSKTELASDQAGGVMVWAVDFDASGVSSLLKAIYDSAPRSALNPVAPSPPTGLTIR